MHIHSEFLTKKLIRIHRCSLMIAVYLLCLANTVFGQVTLITTVNPPFNVPLDQLKDQVTLSLTAGRVNVTNGYITLLIQGDNGVSIQSNLSILDQTVSITAGQTIMLQGQNGDLDVVFQSNALNYTGTTASEVFNSGLPAGSYQICFQYWQDAGQPVSADPPQGCSMFSIQGVSNVNVVTQVMPPYGTELYNYSNSTKVFLQAPGYTGNVSLYMHITGDNGVDLKTRQDYFPNDVSLSNANPVSPIDLAPYFDGANLVSSGQPIEQIMSEGLPEGKYQICVRVRDPDVGFVSPEEPGGCSNMFDIRYSDPPIPVNPICGDTLSIPTQNIVFSWTPAPGAPAFNNYTLKIVEMLDPEQDPNDAMLSATEPAFFEAIVSGALSLYYGPNQPILESGRKYAWQVIAEDKETNTKFKNDGKSEVCWFVWKPMDLIPNTIPGAEASGLSFEILAPSEKKDSLFVNQQQDLYANWGWLYNGDFFNADSLPAFIEKDIQNYRLSIHPGKQKTGHNTDPSFNYQTIITMTDTVKHLAVAHFQRSLDQLLQMGLKNDYWYNIEVEAINSSNSVAATAQTKDFLLALQQINTGPVAHISGQLRYQFDGYPEDYPIPNTSVRFFSTSIPGMKLPNPNTDAASSNTPFQGEDYYTKTDVDGKFKLDIPLPDSPTNVDKYHMEIESPYYQSIETIFNISDSTKSLQLGQLITMVYNYALKLYVKKAFGSYKTVNKDSYYDTYGKLVTKIDTVIVGTPDTTIQEIPAGVTVMLYRKQKPSYLPPVEGQMGQSTFENGIIKIAEGKTAIEIGSDGKQVSYVKFNKLLCNVFSNDVYYLKAVQPDEKGVNGQPEAYKDGPFEGPEQELRFEKSASSGDSTHFEIERTYKIISKDPPKSTISGQLVYSWPGDNSNTVRPLANEDFSIVVEYLYENKPVQFFKLIPNGGYKTELKLDNDPYGLNTGDNGQVMATGTTDSNGHFTIQAVNLNDKGVLGTGTSTTTGGSNPFPTPVPGGIPNIKDMVINPADQSVITISGELTGLENNSIFNFSDMGASFGSQLQLNQLNGAMNGSLGLGMNQQFQGYHDIMNDKGQFFGMRQQAYLGKSIGLHGPRPPKGLINSITAVNGTIQRVFRIKVMDQEFYYNPDKNIVVDPLKATDVGPIQVMVKEVKWNFTAREKINNKTVTLSGLKAVVFRDPSSKVKHLPQGEGDGQYQMKKLINPQYSGDVKLPAKNSGNANSGFGASQKGNWQFNQQDYTNQGLSTSEILNGTQSWPEGSYEWLESDETDSQRKVSFDLLVSGFKDYYLEMVSNPASGELFYEANLTSLDANGFSVQYENGSDGYQIKPSNNSTYGNYWDMRQTDIPQATVDIYMVPKPGRVGGRVMDKSSGLGMKNSIVFLTDTKEKYIAATMTDSAGYYEFLDVLELAKIPQGQPNLTVHIRAYAKGFKQQKESGDLDYKVATASRSGKQQIIDILMLPSAAITGIVKNEQGIPVDAYIKRPDGMTVETQGFKKGFLVLKDNIGKFSLPVPAKPGETAIFYVIPKDPGYFTDTVEVKNMKEGNNDIGVYTVYRREHRIHFYVTDKDNTNLKIGGAVITVNKQQSIQTNSNGEAELSFENVSVNNYTLTITGPKGKMYIPQVINLKNEETKNTKNYWIKLKKGGSIEGLVTLDGKPIRGAKVYLDYKEQNTTQFNGYYQLNLNAFNPGGNQNNPPPNAQALGNGALPQIATFSDYTGHYQLDGIPVNSGQVTLIATLDTTFTVIGDKKTVQLSVGQASQDLVLKSFGDMLVQSIYGFPLSVESISPTNDKNIVNVTGIVKLDQSNSPFSWITSEQSLRIHDVPFSKKLVKGKAIGVPLNDQASLDATSNLKMQYMSRYNVQITHDASMSSGQSKVGELSIQRAKDNKGQMLGYAHIVDNSFNYPSSYFNFKNKDQFFLCQVSKNQVNNHLSVFNALGTDEQPVLNPPQGQLISTQNFHLSNELGMPIKFNFILFDATADPENTYIDSEGKIHLDVSMNCHIPNAQPDHLSVHAGDIVLDNSKVYPASGAKPLTVQLEKWNLEISDWTIDPEKGGIYSEKGLIKTGKLDIPFTEFNLRSDMFVMKGFQLNQLILGGGVKALSDISTGNAVLVYDTKSGSDMSGHWKLAIAGSGNNPAARIKDLTTFLDKDVNIQYIQLLSNDEDIFSIQQSAIPYIINNNKVARFSPQTINSGPDFFTITGGLGIPAPRLVPIMTTLMFTGSPSALKMDIKPIQMGFEGKGYVNFTADNAVNPTISNNQIIIKGQVQEENVFNPITATFYADGGDPSSAHYHIDLKKDFILNLTSVSASTSSSGKYNLKIDHGGMEVPNGASDWNLLSFSGNLLTDDKTLNADGGKANNKMTFTVHGDIDVSGEAVKVSNIDLPFGTMQMVYDFPNKSLHGSLQVNDQHLGPFTAGGSVDMLMDPVGWYFLGACKVNTGLPGPFSSLNMGFLLGNRSYTGPEAQVVTDKVTQFSYSKSSLCWLKGEGGTAIQGFFITAGKSLIDNELGVDLGVASIYLKAMAGGEASLYTKFSDWSFMMSAGLYGKVEAGAAALNISVHGSASLDGSMTGAVSGQGACVGGKIGANVSGSGSIDLEVKSIDFDFSKSAVVKLILSSQSGVDTDFYFGSASAPACDSNSTCGN